MKRYLLLLLALSHALPAFAAKPPYSYFRLGAEVDVQPVSMSPGIVLMGGGTDVDAALQWMCARGGNGDFLVLRATGTEAYNLYIKGLCPNINSVATLIIPSIEAANSAFVAQTVRNAEAIFIAGGDQSNYVNYWKDTALQAALNDQITAGVPIGGTSAGMMVLTPFIYSAQASKGVTSSQALADPYNRYMSFDRDLVNIEVLDGIIGDSHFVTRDRMGRDLAFLCRIYRSNWSGNPRGISVDEETALLIDPKTGSAQVTGSGSAYFLEAASAPASCEKNTPLTYANIGVYRISGANSSFDLSHWTGKGGTPYNVSATSGVLSSTQSGASPY